MKKSIVQLCLACSVMLTFQAYAQQANTNKGYATGVAATRPQVWKTNMDQAKFIEDVVNTLRKIHEGNRATGLPPDFHYDIKQWTQQDVTAFANATKTYDFFETLLGLGNAAVTTDNAGKYTKDAIEAQEGLTYLKPNCCKSWKGFCNMIANASDETETLRAQYRRDSEPRTK